MDLYKSYGIYGIRNKINGKVYVGKTQMNFGDRRDCHFACLRGGYGINKHLQNAWNKYGEDNFEFIVLFECVNGEDDDRVNELEREYIKQYKECGLAYNVGDGGDGGELLGQHLSDEAKRMIGEKNRMHQLGRKASEETKRKMSDSQRRRYEAMTDEEWSEFSARIAEYASGYQWSDESKAAFSKLQQTHPNGAKYDIETVHKMRSMYETEGKTVTEISKELGISFHTVYGIVKYKRWKNV